MSNFSNTASLVTGITSLNLGSTNGNIAGMSASGNMSSIGLFSGLSLLGGNTTPNFGNIPTTISGIPTGILQSSSRSSFGSTLGNIGGTLGSLGSALIPSVYNSSGVDTAFLIGDSVADTLASFNPFIGGLAKGAMFLTKGINSVFGSSTKDMAVNTETKAKSGNDYNGTNYLIADAKSKANRRYGLFSRGSRNAANREIDRATLQLNTLTGIMDNATDAFAMLSGMSDITNKRYGLDLNGGYQQKYTMVGRKGFKMPTPLEMLVIKESLSKYKSGGNITHESYIVATEIIPDIEEFKDGGKLHNVIPEGALHARLNNMDNNNITNKGIPVVVETKEGVQLQAEIERNEIIFNKKVTTKIEELYKDGSDKAAIECGKLLALEIIENTEDRTGLMKNI